MWFIFSFTRYAYYLYKWDLGGKYIPPEKHGACWSVGDLPFIITELKSSRTRCGLYIALRGMHIIYINGIWGGVNIFHLKNMVHVGLLGIYLLSSLN